MITKPEFISIEKSIYGHWKVRFLINGEFYQTYIMDGYTKQEAIKLARREAVKESSLYFYNEA